MQFGNLQLKRCKHGWMLFTGPYIGKCLELYGQYSEAEVAVIRAFIGPGDTAIDIGANIGDLTLPMALAAGPTGRVFAFESHSANFNVLCANLALNQVENTKPIFAFVADSDTVDTSGPWGRFGFVSKEWQPDIVGIDALKLEACSFIKIDVDGKELEVLRSGRETIARLRPVLYVENDQQEKSAALLEHLMAADYCLYWHFPPIFEPKNFYDNPVNHWAPTNILSKMVLCIPAERDKKVTINLNRIVSKDEW